MIRSDVLRDSLIVSESQKECARRQKKCHLCTGRQCEWGENGVGKNALARVQYFKKCRWWGSGNDVIITKQYKEAGVGKKGAGEVSP